MDAMVDLFTVMFPDSDIAKGMKMKKDKANYLIKHGLAPYFEKLLIDKVSSSFVHSLSFDESANTCAQKGQMDIMVRFWDEDKMAAETRYFNISVYGGSEGL